MSAERDDEDWNHRAAVTVTVALILWAATVITLLAVTR